MQCVQSNRLKATFDALWKKLQALPSNVKVAKPKLKFMRPFDTVLVCQLSVCHISGFYLERLFTF